MSGQAQEERPRIGDRVKLIGAHRYAGFTGVYVSDHVFWNGSYPIVRLEDRGTTVRTLVLDPENQMRKA